ncbi:DUF6095 family protein [Mesoflavibacter sp.]|uniref:DUF6095 family protein n=1 Tax=Mesoflavibacter sp. TaxID=1930902 RepID=UPI003518DD83
METKSTDKEILIKGLKQLGLSLLLMFIGPSFLYLILSNKDKQFYIVLLILGIIICSLAVYFAFKGINTILKSLFESNKTK